MVKENEPLKIKVRNLTREYNSDLVKKVIEKGALLDGRCKEE